MAAITVEDTGKLPRLAAPPPGVPSRPVRSVTVAPKGFEGEGFPRPARL